MPHIIKKNRALLLYNRKRVNFDDLHINFNPTNKFALATWVKKPNTTTYTIPRTTQNVSFTITQPETNIIMFSLDSALIENTIYEADITCTNQLTADMFSSDVNVIDIKYSEGHTIAKVKAARADVMGFGIEGVTGYSSATFVKVIDTRTDEQRTFTVLPISGYVGNQQKFYPNILTNINTVFDINLTANKTYRISILGVGSNMTSGRFNNGRVQMKFKPENYDVSSNNGEGTTCFSVNGNANLYNCFGGWNSYTNPNNLPKTFTFTITPTQNIVQGCFSVHASGDIEYIIPESITIEEVINTPSLLSAPNVTTEGETDNE